MAKKNTTKKIVKSVKKTTKKAAPKRIKKASATGASYTMVVKPSKPSFSDEMIGRMMASSKSY